MGAVPRCCYKTNQILKLLQKAFTTRHSFGGRIDTAICNILQTENSKTAVHNKLALHWQAACRNVYYDVKHRYASKNFRDSIMAKNLLYLSASEFKGEKIIC